MTAPPPSAPPLALRPSPPSLDDLLRELDLGALSTKQQAAARIKRDFLTPPRHLSEPAWLDSFALHWNDPAPTPKFPLDPCPPTHAASFRRKGLDGLVDGWIETKAPPPPPSAIASLSTSRAPGAVQSFVRGRSANMPFLPGGLDGVLVSPGVSGEAGVDEDDEDEDEDEEGWRTRAPGFKRGPAGPLKAPRRSAEPAGGAEDDKEREAREEEEAVIAAFLGRSSNEGIRRPAAAAAAAAAPAANGTPAEGDVREKVEFLLKSEEERRALAAQNAASDQLPVSGLDDLLPLSFASLSLSDPAAKKAKRRRKALEKKEWAHVVDVKQNLMNFDELVPDMAFKYPFELDNFQKEAIYHLEMGDSVFVAAHTSAGKTVVAEYAIALAARHMTRAIYTSPIKALSNQKFRDFKQTFDPSTIGILTGDVQINPEGACLIMTTEILRSMLYKGADLIRDVEFVIFDEVHYVNDAERGVVWEEVIILLPEHVNIILLSATVPNTKEFAGWVGRTKKKDIYVISTPKRPVPLEHFLWAGKDLHKILDSTGKFLGDGLKSAGEALRRKQDKEREAAGLAPVQRTGGRGGARGGAAGGRGGAPPRGGGRGGGPARGGAVVRGRGGGGGAPSFRSHAPDKNLWTHLVAYLQKKNLLPVVCFIFSKKRCEENASSLGNTDLCTAKEKSAVHVTIERALKRLNGSDKRLPQIQRMRDLLSRGIGVHHGGLLPIVKEVVEILFAQGYVKVLFATETFAMGVNMPARSVVFSGIRKHDGKGFRELLPGEYTQMSGRAGRRGLDATGVVIIVCDKDEVPETAILNQMMLGQPTKLSSQFRLTYNMILNLLRVEALRVEEMIKRSFSENASQTLLPEQQERVLELERLIKKLPKSSNPDVTDALGHYYEVAAELVHLNNWMLGSVLAASQGSKHITAGRVVILRDGRYETNVAIILRPVTTMSATSDASGKSFIVLTLVDAADTAAEGQDDLQLVTPPPIWPPTTALLKLPVKPAYDVRMVSASSITLVTNRSHKLDADAIRAIADRARKSVINETLNALVDIAAEFQEDGAFPEVDWSKSRKLDFQDALKARTGLVKQQRKRNISFDADFKAHYSAIHEEKELQRRMNDLKAAISDQNLELLPDYESRIEVLKELRFIDENSTVLLKGRVACEINSANELILTELILENTLATFAPEEIVALLSCFVFHEKSEGDPVIPEQLVKGKEIILDIAEKLGRVQDQHKVPHEDYATTLKFGLVEAVYEWAKGMPFEQITELTDVAEGTIVRVITRLDQACHEVRDSARVIGDGELMAKMEQAQTLIKRDIVFAASLYF